ncbi:MAG: UDP-N-acetylmuramoyl-L-alanine--D-glutamate ligase, partial [Bacteroidetes bacterium]|nr:UDP-N-acetylmuramoyl-L-alanine--D-glutamate ligase [Bacteroidota bacterium]
GNDYSRLTELVRKHVRAVVAIGESADKVERSFADVSTVKQVSNMEEAVRTAQMLAKRGDVVLLSPACASFDWFNNYEHRGVVFKELVNKL